VLAGLLTLGYPVGLEPVGAVFRRVNSHLHLAKLTAEPEFITAETTGADRHSETIKAV